MDSIRNSAKAIILQDEMLLAIEHADSQGKWYVLPGGGQNKGETLTAALERECLEEIGVNVQVGRLRFVREYIGSNHEFWEKDGRSHQVEFMFDCRIVEGHPVGLGPIPDTGQLGTAWLPVNKIMDFRLYPLSMRGFLISNPDLGPFYLGDVN